MAEKTYLYEWNENDLKDIEKEAFKKANELNDKILDVKIFIDEIASEWEEYIKYLEDNKISKICEFRGGNCIDFSDELRNAIVTTLKQSLNDTNKSLKYNSKKIGINRVING
ncbi:hypothetical protein [Methanobrevibacter sp. V74]|uniref:hypothetical protein n=1 Tax=Methanobrevibacter sp. V74 TaxID=3064279 RepID=UPI00273394B4|nr:hypothetical protein [Methanobrevibacter sp. V74]